MRKVGKMEKDIEKWKKKEIMYKEEKEKMKNRIKELENKLKGKERGNGRW